MASTTREMKAALSPLDWLFASTVSSNLGPSYFPSLGSTILSVTQVPTMVSSTVDTIMKYQLAVLGTT